MINNAIAVAESSDEKRATLRPRAHVASHWLGHVSVRVTHTSPLLAAGLLATLQGIPGCDVSLAGEASPAKRRIAAVDVLITDHCTGLADVDLPAGKASPGRRARPRVILLTNETPVAAGEHAQAHAFDVCLPVDCPTDELIAAVHQLSHPTPWSAPGPENISVGMPLRGGLSPGKLRAVRTYIEDHLAEGADLGTLAGIAGMSCCHFARAFKRSTGMPAHHYLITRRISAALALIRDTDRALCEISLDVGFADQSHFTRTFVQLTGMTPGDYRHWSH